MWRRHHFSSGAAYGRTLAGGGHKSHERSGSRASSTYLRFFTIETRQWRCFLLRCYAVATAVAVARAASCRTQRASPVNAHMLPLTLSPANLSFQASTIRCGSHGQRPIAPEEWYKEAEDPHTPPANQ